MNYTKFIILLGLISGCYCQAQEDISDEVEYILSEQDASSWLDTDSEKSFIVSLLMIIVSEIGDKTFLIAAIMAMKHPRLLVFTGAFSSLVVMSILSAFLGHVVPNLVPKQYTDACASVLFFCFGARMIYEAYHMNDDENSELYEVEDELKSDDEETGKMDTEDVPKKKKNGLVNLMQLVFSPVFVQTFILTFLGEWGDRSQISTIALAAANNVYFVTMGVIIGHAMCTSVAVLGGRMLATKISVRTVTLAGAILFLIFGVLYGYGAYQGHEE